MYFTSSSTFRVRSVGQDNESASFHPNSNSSFYKLDYFLTWKIEFSKVVYYDYDAAKPKIGFLAGTDWFVWSHDFACIIGNRGIEIRDQNQIDKIENFYRA